MKFREYHLSTVLKSFELQKIPLDAFLSRYFRAHRAIGSKDRLFITETIYHYIRWKNLYQYVEKEPSFLDPHHYVDDPQIPLHIRYGTPSSLYHLLTESYGTEKTHEICQTSNSRAPLTIRINPLKTSREALLSKWKGLFDISPCQNSSLGIQFHQKINFHTLAEYKNGLFEIQDEASQLAAELVRAKPQQKILDYCAGAGGKTLAFAHQLKNSGQIYLHDIRPRALQEARKRLCRAGVQNVQFSPPAVLPAKFDWVVVDVPCTGTGTFRRNPDLKWKFENTDLEKLVQEQRKIFQEAVGYLRPGGVIVYMTCSLLPCENEAQASFFEQTYSLKRIEIFQTPPISNGMDGFFAISLKSII